MKKLLLLIFPFILFSGDILILKSGKRDLSFLKETNFRNLQSVSNNSIYYMYGIKNENTKVVSDGTIVIGFISTPNIEKFSEENSLKLIRRNSSGTYIFKNLESIDIIKRSNQLSNLDNIKIVAPNWKRVRGLK